MKPGGILFVGLNPSFSLEGWRKLVGLARQEKLVGDDFDAETFFRWGNRAAFDQELSCKLESLAHRYYPFYQHHSRLAKQAGLHWAHVDVFAWRDPEQPRAERLLFTKRGAHALTPFGECQFEIFQKLLTAVKPRLIVFVNSLASKLYQARRALRFDSDSGCYWDGVLATTPVLFSGMLTYLDRFSRDRLFWSACRLVGRRWEPA